MEENQEVTNSAILKHYLSSLLIYGLVLLFITFCPAFTDSVLESPVNYAIFFLIYYICYAIFALPLFYKFRPKSILNSHNVAIIDYVKRQFNKGETTQDWLKNIEPTDFEKQSMMILFMKSFFGVYCVNMLLSKYLPSLDYSISFLKEMFTQALTYTNDGQGLAMGILQYIDDTADMWIKIFIMLTTLILTISYLTDLDLFKNKIKSIDTTPLGVISCLVCYYPFTILASNFIKIYEGELVPVGNLPIRIILNILSVFANLMILIAVARLNTKSGNLTNRGIVQGFPYNVIRHPDYTMQVLYIIATTAPLLFISNISLIGKTIIVCGTAAWIFIYYLRAITEERHLIKDSEYQQYCEKVKYRFIPKLF